MLAPLSPLTHALTLSLTLPASVAPSLPPSPLSPEVLPVLCRRNGNPSLYRRRSARPGHPEGGLDSAASWA